MTAGFTFIGVPIDSVGRSGGTEHGPAKLRELGLADVCGADAGDLDVRIRGEERDPITGIVGSPDVLTTTAAIREATAHRSRQVSGPSWWAGAAPSFRAPWRGPAMSWAVSAWRTWTVTWTSTTA